MPALGYDVTLVESRETHLFLYFVMVKVDVLWSFLEQF